MSRRELARIPEGFSATRFRLRKWGAEVEGWAIGAASEMEAFQGRLQDIGERRNRIALLEDEVKRLEMEILESL